MMASLRRYLISGLLVWIPVWVTYLVIKFIVELLDKTLLLLPPHYRPDELLGFHIPGMGVIITILLIIFTGMIAANFLGKRLVKLWDAVVGRIPLVRTVYNSVKKIMETLFMPGGEAFRKVLLVEFPRAGLWSIGFQTGNSTKAVDKAFS